MTMCTVDNNVPTFIDWGSDGKQGGGKKQESSS